MNASKVDVVILTWNDGALLDAALASVEASALVTTHVYVVDNGSDPAAEVPDGVHLIRSDHNLGVAAGRNRGIAAGSSPFVLILDSDAALKPDALGHLVAPLLLDRTIAMTVPVYTDQRPTESAGLAPTLRRKLARVRNQTNDYEAAPRPAGAEQWDVDFGIGACQLFSRAAWEQVGGIEETYFYGPEDVDFCLRVQSEVGRIVQLANAVVDHPPRRRFRGLTTKRGMAHAWAVTRFLWRHRNRPSVPGSVTPTKVNS